MVGYRQFVRRPVLLAAIILVPCVLFLLISGRGDEKKLGPVRSWGWHGVVRLEHFEIKQTLEDSRGRVLVVGFKDDDGFAQIVRLRTDGSLDPSFGKHGVVSWPRPAIANRAIHFHPGWDMAALLPGGKIALAGTSLFGLVDERSTLVVSELNENGRIIRSFGKNGYFTTKMASCIRGPTGMTAQGDRLVVAVNHFCKTYDSAGQRLPNRIALMRLTRAGEPDASFARGGQLTVVESRALALVSPHTPLLTRPQNHLALLVPGAAGGLVEIVGLLENGTLDQRFGQKGTASARVAFDSEGNIFTSGLSRDKEGSLTIAGCTDAGPFLARFNRKGGADDYWGGSPWEPWLKGVNTNYENFGGAFGVCALFAPRRNGDFFVAGDVLARIHGSGTINRGYPTRNLYKKARRTVRNLIVLRDGTALVSLTQWHDSHGKSIGGGTTTFIERYR